MRGSRESLCSWLQRFPSVLQVGTEEYHPLLSAPGFHRSDQTQMLRANRNGSPEGTLPSSEKDRSSFDSGGQSYYITSLFACQSVIPVYICTDGERSRDSSMLPETIFTGRNTNLGFTANIPIWSLPYKNSLSLSFRTPPLQKAPAVSPSLTSLKEGPKNCVKFRLQKI